MIFFGRPTVAITPERPVYLPGEEVRAFVQIRGEGELALQEVRVELRRLQRYAYQRRERNSNGRYHWDNERRTDELVCDVRRILDAGTLQEGMVVEQIVSLRLPSTAEGSGNGGLLDTSWEVHLVLNRRMAIDVTATAAIVVLSPAALFAGRIAADWRGNQPGECSVAFQLPTRQVRLGSVLGGTLIVHARQAVEARGLRVELQRVEMTVPGSSSYQTRGRNDDTTVLKQQIAPGGTLPFDSPIMVPFELPIPEGLPPTTFAAHGTIRWLLRGVVDRSFATDYWGEVEVNLYNGPDLPTATAEMPTALPASDIAAGAPTGIRLVLVGLAPEELRDRTVVIDAPLTTLGRRETSDVVIPVERVSRDHATIRREGAAFFVRDLESTGGTTINGEPLTGESPLRDGDTLTLGNVAAFSVQVVGGGNVAEEEWPGTA